MKILIVEDDPEMGELTERWLNEHDYRTHLATNGVDALIALAEGDFAAAAVDVMLPGMSGFELCRRIRESGSQIPLILITARDAVEDRIYGLDAGADDYLTKPFDLSELGARLRAVLRRRSIGPQTLVRVGNVELDSMKMRTLVRGRTIALSLREFSLLRLLALTPGDPVSRATILEEVWEATEHIDPNIVEQYISFLRRKIDADDAAVRIVTVRGHGYRLDDLS